MNINFLTFQQWQSLRLDHIQLLSPFLENFRCWREKGQKHPVYDFLFSYYSFSTGQLLRWTPGINVALQCAESTVSSWENDNEWPDHFKLQDGYLKIELETFPIRRLAYLDWAIRYLTATSDRPAIFHCFGMHEWAMLYNTDSRQHPETPLRVSRDVIFQTVSSLSLCCTHYDAYRFFTPEARPLNRQKLCRESVMDSDQSGCIHANMDLYKFGYKIAPYIPSELLAKLFLLAKTAREIDMRASPYDLSNFEMEPIKVETREGRESYLTLQKELHTMATPLRKALLDFYLLLRQEIHLANSTVCKSKSDLGAHTSISNTF